MHNAQSVLLHGEHTRRIAQPTPTAKAGGIMQFAKIRLSCIGCRAPISDEKMSKSLCKNCLNDESQHLRKGARLREQPRGRLQPALDAVSAVPRLTSPRRPLHIARLSHFLPSQKSPKGFNRSHGAAATFRLVSATKIPDAIVESIPDAIVESALKTTHRAHERRTNRDAGLDERIAAVSRRRLAPIQNPIRPHTPPRRRDVRAALARRADDRRPLRLARQGRSRRHGRGVQGARRSAPTQPSR